MPDAVRVATLARDARKDAAWLAHVAATGHHEGDSSRNTVECQQCSWAYIDEAPLAVTPAGDFEAPSYTAWQRDLDREWMAEQP